MKRIIIAVAAVLALSFVAMSASACPGVCKYEGKEYSAGATIHGGKRICRCHGESCNWDRRD